MNEIEATKLVKKQLNVSDNRLFDDLVEKLKDISLITRDEFIKGANELKELLVRNNVEIIAQQNGDMMNFHVIHKGKEIT